MGLLPRPRHAEHAYVTWYFRGRETGSREICKNSANLPIAKSLVAGAVFGVGLQHAGHDGASRVFGHAPVAEIVQVEAIG